MLNKDITKRAESLWYAYVGAHLKASMLILFNEMKKNLKFPQFMKIANMALI